MRRPSCSGSHHRKHVPLGIEMQLHEGIASICSHLDHQCCLIDGSVHGVGMDRLCKFSEGSGTELIVQRIEFGYVSSKRPSSDASIGISLHCGIT